MKTLLSTLVLLSVSACATAPKIEQVTSAPETHEVIAVINLPTVTVTPAPVIEAASAPAVITEFVGPPAPQPEVTPVAKVDEPKAVVTPQVTASTATVTSDSWVVTDDEGNIIQESNSNEVRSIASISKLITAMIVLDAKQNMNEHISIRVKRKSLNLTRQQLLQIALVRSYNPAAEALCDNYPGGRSACVAAMNAKVKSLGLVNTHFFEPTGLDENNVSTAKELVTIVLASQKYPEIEQAASTKSVKISYKFIHRHKKRVKTLVFNNTNHDVEKSPYKFIVSKTGYIHQAGACIVVMIDSPNFGRRIVVLLNSKNTHTRVPEAELLANSTKSTL